MATKIVPQRDSDREESEQLFTILHRRYEISPNASLADVGLDIGHFLPDDAEAEILTSKFVEFTTKDRLGNVTIGTGRMVDVVARKWVLWS